MGMFDKPLGLKKRKSKKERVLEPGYKSQKDRLKAMRAAYKKEQAEKKREEARRKKKNAAVNKKIMKKMKRYLIG